MKQYKKQITLNHKAMKTSALLKLHQRQVDTLEMIIKCNDRLSMWDNDLRQAQKQGSNSIWWPHNIKRTEEYIYRNKAIKQRLISYYKDIQIRIMTLQPEIELNTTSEMDLSTTLS